MSGVRTQADRIPYFPENGSDLVVGAGNLGEQVRLWIAGEAFPRIILDIPNGKVLAGSGAVAPFSVAGQITYVHPPTGTVDVDQPMLDQAISDTAAGGLIVLGNGGSTPYARSTPWVIPKSLSIEGAGIVLPVAFANGEQPLVSPFLTGPVILQTGAGVDGVQITQPNSLVNLKNIGIRFDNPGTVAFANTGHGINADPGAGFTSLSNSRFEDLWVFGHDGNHYAYTMRGFVLCRFIGLRSIGGGHLLLDDNGVPGGNSIFEDTFGSLCCAGTAQGIGLKSSLAAGLGLFNWIRPQINTNDFSASAAYGNPAKPAPPQAIWEDGLGTGFPFNQNIDAWDGENNAGINQEHWGPTTYAWQQYIGADNLQRVAFGPQATSGPQCVSVGHLAQGNAPDAGAVAVGNGAQANADVATAIGWNTRANFRGSVAIGVDFGFVPAQAAAINEFIIGTNNHLVKIAGNVGFFGAAPVGRAAAPAVLNDVITILRNLGLCT